MLERELRELSFVPRWSVLRRVTSQTVAEHSFYVATYAAHLADLVGWNGDRGALLRAALAHDLPEAATGDIPGPAKRLLLDEWHSNRVEHCYVQSRFPHDEDAWIASKTDPEIKALVKAADILDEIMFLQTEAQLGNKNVGHADNPTTPMGNSITRLRKWWSSTPLLNSSGPGAWDFIMLAIDRAGSQYSNIVIDETMVAGAEIAHA